MKHRCISFFLTTPQIRSRTKSVTRRMGWAPLKPGTRLWACVKCQGLKKGERVERLAMIEVVEVSRERLRRMTDEPAYGRMECVAEGFPHLTPAEFVAMFCASHKGCTPETVVTRIAFRYVQDGAR
jgi:hypothetical protein